MCVFRDHLNSSCGGDDSVKAELEWFLAQQALPSDTKLLVLANKQDVAGCMSVAEITEHLDRESIATFCQYTITVLFY